MDDLTTDVVDWLKRVTMRDPDEFVLHQLWLVFANGEERRWKRGWVHESWPVCKALRACAPPLRRLGAGGWYEVPEEIVEKLEFAHALLKGEDN